MGEPKSDRCGSFTSAGWKRQHGGKDMPSNWRSPPRPGAKSLEQGRSYNRLNREVDRVGHRPAGHHLPVPERKVQTGGPVVSMVIFTWPQPISPV